MAKGGTTAVGVHHPQRLVVQVHVAHTRGGHGTKRIKRLIANRRAVVHEFNFFGTLRQTQFFVPGGDDFEFRLGQICRQHLIVFERNRDIGPRKIADDADPATGITELTDTVSHHTSQIRTTAHIVDHCNLPGVMQVSSDIDRKHRLTNARKHHIAVHRRRIGGQIRQVGATGISTKEQRRTINNQTI